MFRICLLTIFLFFIFTCCVHAKSLCIVTLNNAPQAYMENGSPAGFLVEMVEEAVRRSGYSADIYIVPWIRALALVRSGDADAIFHAYHTEERKKFLRYTDTSLLQEKVVAIRRKGDDVYFDLNFSGAEKYIAGVGRDYSYGEKVDQALKEKKFKRIEVASDFDLNVQKLLYGRIDFFFADYYPVLKILNDKHLLDEVEPVLSTETGLPLVYSKSESYLAFSRKTKSEVFIKVNSALKQMKVDGTFKQIMLRYVQ
nr:transporter substrate-binding domain-containing protein [Maridesulfovibrio sp.]